MVLSSIIIHSRIKILMEPLGLMVQYSGKDLGDFRAFLETQFRRAFLK
jgi:hypothetical protein